MQIDKKIINSSRIKYVLTSSKSYLHRFIILAFLTPGDTIIKNVNLCDDVICTLNALYKSYRLKGKDLFLYDKDKCFKKEINVGESGSTFRFLIPLAMDGEKRTFITSGKLIDRPLEYYKQIADENGICFTVDRNTLTVEGRLKENIYFVDSQKTSQYISGMLFASLGKFNVNYNLEKSAQYIDITIDALNRFGYKKRDGIYYLDNPKNKNIVYVPSDASNDAFYYVLKSLGCLGKIKSLRYGSQRDNIILKWISAGCNSVDLKNNIDIAPVLSSFFALKNKKSTLKGIENLVYKESNRQLEILRVLKKFNINFKLDGNKLIIGNIKSNNKPLYLNVNDHRICQMAIILAIITKRKLYLKGISSLKKSDINMYNNIRSL